MRSLWFSLPLIALSCHSPHASLPADRVPTTPDVEVSRAPFFVVHCAFKERIEQPYVYFELTGSYAVAGRSLPEVQRRMQEQGLSASGPPFALFYDDPGQVPFDRLRARVCFPVESQSAVREPLRSDVLPSATVVYALAAGAYPEVPRCYPGVLGYVHKMQWVVSGPIREIYLVEPSAVKDWSELRCEVQVPVSMGP